MKQDKYELNNALQDHKNRLRLAQKSLELVETELKETQRELARMKRLYEPKSRCANCSGGCVASEINGRVCSPR